MSLPEKDKNLSNKEQGVYRKFIVSRADGKDQPGGKYEGSFYFVLDVNNDPLAKTALMKYIANAEEAGFSKLAADLLQVIEIGKR